MAAEWPQKAVYDREQSLLRQAATRYETELKARSGKTIRKFPRGSNSPY